ncbi:MAG: polysaccharide biosynthesis tyrosine autokinase [Sedimentisphaerales bacterium]|nr:polysaccharide biosynthesis tyrosine autokinase [Sedimentisphaerales bacterium]
MATEISLPATGIQAPQRRQVVPSAATGTGITYKDVMGILRRRMWLIIIVTAVFVILSAALWCIFLVYSPEYASVGFVRCKMPIQEGLFGMGGVTPRKDVITMATASNAELLNNEFFLSEVLERTRVKETQWYIKRKDDLEKRLDDMQKSFSAFPRRDTEFVMVRMVAASPKEAKDILDEALRQFQIQREESATKTLRRSLEALTGQRRKVDTKIRTSQSKLVDLTQRAETPGWQTGGGRTVVLQELSLLHEERLRLESEIQQLRIYEAQLQQINVTQGYSSTVRMAIEQDPMVNGYRSQVANLVQQRDMLIKRLGPEHRQVQDIQSTIDVGQAQLSNREQMLQQQYGGQETEMISRQIISMMEQLKVINSQYDEVSERQRDLDQKLVSYAVTQKEIDNLNRQLAVIEQEIQSISVKMNDPDRVPVEIAQYGSDPLERSFPKPLSFIMGGLVSGLAVSLGLAFLLEFMNDSVQTPRDVQYHLRVPLLGTIPLYEQEEGAEKISVEKVAMTHPHALISESYRKLRTNLFFIAPPSEFKTILITGSSADCGKTTTAVNLSIALAAEGRHVLLVDANFRRPAFNRLFPAEGPGRGLSNILVGQATVADAIRPSGIEGLELIDSGPLPPNPADLLNSKRMCDFLESRKQHYDFVILDGPPSLLVADANIIAGQVDGIIAVINAEHATRGMAQRMIRELKGCRMRRFGVVLNAVRSRKGGYFEKASQSYYDYISEGQMETVESRG